MNQYKKRWQLKNLAKDTLQGKYSKNVLLTLVYGVFLLAEAIVTELLMYRGSNLTYTMVNIMNGHITIFNYTISLIVSIILEVIFGLFSAGICLFYLNIACNQPFSVRDFFGAFKEQPTKFLQISLVQAGISFLFMLPAYASNFFYLMTASAQWVFLAYGCQIFGWLISLPITIGLSQSYRILWDFPSLSAGQALRHSYQLMRGHKWRLFILMASFIPLEILAVFTLGIGFLWLYPYMSMTYALFFLELMTVPSNQ